MRSRTAAVAVLLSLSLVAGLFAQTPAAKSTQRKLTVPPGLDGSAEIPVITINGLSKGPTVAVISGQQGGEAAPFLAISQFAKELIPSQLKGTLILIPIANTPSFAARILYTSPGDHKALSRSFPGKADGTITERIAYTITQEVLAKVDYVIELRSGEVNELVTPHTYQYTVSDAKLNARGAEMASAFGISLIVIDKASSGGCAQAALALGKPAIMVEAGGMNSPERTAVDGIQRGIQSVLNMLDMLPGRAMTGSGATYFDGETRLVSPANGMLVSYVVRGEHIHKGDPVAGVADYFGQNPQVIKAPVDGIVLSIMATPPVNKGETVAIIGTPKE
jgi:predicted deacylase